MGTRWDKILNKLFGPILAPSVSTLDHWDGVGHKHVWKEHGLVFRCECGMRVPRND